MEYIKHYEKNFSDLLNVSNIDHVKQESFNFFSKSGFPIKKKGDERWKYLDLRSLEKTIYSIIRIFDIFWVKKLAIMVFEAKGKAMG